MRFRHRVRRALIRSRRWANTQRHDALVLLGIGLLSYGIGGVVSGVFGAEYALPVAAIVFGLAFVRSVAAGTQERR